VVWRVNILRAQASTQHISIIFSGSEFDSLTSKPISFRLFPSSAAHCHSSVFLQKLQCNLLYEVSYEVTAVEGCCGYGIFKQCSCCYSCTVTVLAYVIWETNTAVEGWYATFLFRKCKFTSRPEDWQFWHIFDVSLSPPSPQIPPSSSVTYNTTVLYHRIRFFDDAPQ
jgi:hypothetical protein